MRFTYQNPTVIQFGVGKIKSLVRFLEKDKKILMVYGGGSIKTNGVYDQVKTALEGYTLFEFSGVEPNPTIETMNKAIEIIKKEKIDFVLAVGGGSVIDGCKYLVAASLYEGDGWDFLDGKKVIKEALPLGVVLTLPATGSESNCFAVVSKKSTDEKRSLESRFLFPTFAILDPSIMSTLSDRQMGNGLVDAFIHTCEQYLTYPTSSVVQEGYAQTLLKALVDLGNTWEDRRSLQWCENLMWIANQALNGLIGAGVPQDWATHCIGHELTAFYGIDHARSLAVVQPQLLRVMMEDKEKKLIQLGETVFGIKNDANATILAMESLYEKVGVTTNLNHYDIDDNVISKVVDSLERHGMTKIGENANITLEHTSKILTMAMH
ncbi:MAG: iron-containing alcohol dehydrogenase [Campylobacteraceae bacterium]|nr:iron-containing alcohol dehydrogenase [Campylobacteraceae bacterium]